MPSIIARGGFVHFGRCRILDAAALPIALPAPVCAMRLIAVAVYWPLARVSAGLEKLGRNVDHLPLSAYRHRSLYAMRTDALDRFGTRLEKRFTREEMRVDDGRGGIGKYRLQRQCFLVCGRLCACLVSFEWPTLTKYQ